MDFLCSCAFCQKDDENENDFAFYEKFAKIYKEAENLKIDRINSFQSVSNCRKEVDLYKELYKISQEKNIPPTALSEILQRGFDASSTGIFFQKPSFLHQLTHNMARDCSLNSLKNTSSQHVVYKYCLKCQNKKQKNNI